MTFSSVAFKRHTISTKKSWFGLGNACQANSMPALLRHALLVSCEELADSHIYLFHKCAPGYSHGYPRNENIAIYLLFSKSHNILPWSSPTPLEYQQHVRNRPETVRASPHYYKEPACYVSFIHPRSTVSCRRSPSSL